MRAPPVVFELLQKYFWHRAGFEPTEIEIVLLSVHCSTSKPPRLDGYGLWWWLNEFIQYAHVYKVNIKEYMEIVLCFWFQMF